MLASQQYGLKEISELLKIDYGKVRKKEALQKIKRGFRSAQNIREKGYSL